MFRSVFGQYMGQRRSVYVLFFGRLVTSMGALIWPMLTLILSRKIGYSDSEVGFILIGIGFIFLPATWIGGKLADRFDRRLLIVVMDSVSVIFFIGCAFVEPGTTMLVFFVIAGWFANMEAPVFEALIIDVTKPEEREVAYSLTYLGKNLGMTVGIALGGLLFNNFLHVAFIIDGVTTFISTIAIVAFVVIIKAEDLKDSTQNVYEGEIDVDEKTFKVLLDRRPVFIQLFVFFMTGIVYDQYMFALPLYMDHLYGASGVVYYGYVASFNAGIVILLTPFITKYSERYSELPKVMIGIGLFSASYLLILGSPIFMVFFVFMILFTVGEILNMLGTSPYVSRRVPGTHRGRVNSWVYIAFFLGSMTGKGFVGVMLERYSYEPTFILLAILGGITVLITAYNYKIDKSRFPKLYNKKLKIADEVE